MAMMQRKHNEETFKEVLEQWLKTYQHRRKLNEARITDTWYRLMGPAISKYTQSVQFKNNTLHISLESAALRAELAMATDKIMQNINEDLGDDIVKRVIIR